MPAGRAAMLSVLPAALDREAVESLSLTLVQHDRIIKKHKPESEASSDNSVKFSCQRRDSASFAADFVTFAPYPRRSGGVASAESSATTSSKDNVRLP